MTIICRFTFCVETKQQQQKVAQISSKLFIYTCTMVYWERSGKGSFVGVGII